MTEDNDEVAFRPGTESRYADMTRVVQNRSKSWDVYDRDGSHVATVRTEAEGKKILDPKPETIVMEHTETKRITLDNDPETIRAFEAGGWHLQSSTARFKSREEAESAMTDHKCSGAVGTHACTCPHGRDHTPAECRLTLVPEDAWAGVGDIQ